MNPDISEVINVRRWNRNMLKAYWFMLLTAILTHAIYLLSVHPMEWVFVIRELAVPAIPIIIILLLTQFLNSQIQHCSEYIIISSGTLIIATVLYYQPDITALHNTTFIPILISVFYFKVKKVIFSFISMFIVTLGLYILEIMNSGENSSLFIELITTMSILICGTIISLGIMHRGIELLKKLIATMESRQELLIQNIMMDKLSKIDPLTELYNHITFHEYLDRLTEQSDRFNFSLQLAILDIDNFKKVNDTYGHRAGDAVIKRIAQALQEHVHTNDFVARYGGEEFAIVFSEKHMNDVYEKLEQIRLHIASIHHPELGANAVTISMGMSEYQTGTNKEVIFQHADEALYIAKKSGKNRIFIKTETDPISL